MQMRSWKTLGGRACFSSPGPTELPMYAGSTIISQNLVAVQGYCSKKLAQIQHLMKHSLTACNIGTLVAWQRSLHLVVHSDPSTSSGVISGHGNQLGLVEQLQLNGAKQLLHACFSTFH